MDASDDELHASASCANCCLRCCPREASVVQFNCLIVIIGFFITILFGRSVVATALGTIGIVVSLEVYFNAPKGKKWLFRGYAVYMLLNTAACVAVGVTDLLFVEINCSGAANTTTCDSVSQIHGLVILLGAGTIGLFASINACLVSCTIRGGNAHVDPMKEMLEAHEFRNAIKDNGSG